jgi:hypothetical protein
LACQLSTDARYELWCADLILEFANDFPDQVLGVLVSTASRAVSANLRALSTAQELAKLGTPPPPPDEG